MMRVGMKEVVGTGGWADAWLRVFEWGRRGNQSEPRRQAVSDLGPDGGARNRRGLKTPVAQPTRVLF